MRRFALFSRRTALPSRPDGSGEPSYGTTARGAGLAWWLAPLALALLSAAPLEKAERLVRLGDEAFEREDYAAAVVYYTQAEDHITDPGLVAFNKGAALYRLGRFREAELHYLRCREDAAGERRARLLYDLANAILQQAQDRDAARLEQVIGHYEECLRLAQPGSPLVEDARFNLRLARALLVKARTARDPSNPDNPNPDNNPDSRDHPNDPRRGDFRPGSLDPRGSDRAVADQRGDPSRDPADVNQPPLPGMGNLPLIPDQDDLAPLSPEDTTAYLEQVAARVLRERREHKQRSAAPSARTPKDW